MFNSSNPICWKDYILPTGFLLFLYQRPVDYIYVGLFLGSVSCFIDLLIYSFPITVALQ
jgi:hypothetical protein